MARLVIALGDEIQSDLVPGSIVGQAGIIFFAQTILQCLGGRSTWATSELNPPWSSVGAGPVLMHELGPRRRSRSRQRHDVS